MVWMCICHSHKPGSLTFKKILFQLEQGKIPFHESTCEARVICLTSLEAQEKGKESEKKRVCIKESQKRSVSTRMPVSPEPEAQTKITKPDQALSACRCLGKSLTFPLSFHIG